MYGSTIRDSYPQSQLEKTSNHRDMDPQYATVDQLAEIIDTMASLRDAILGLGQRIDRHQAQPLPISGSTRMTLLYLYHHHHHLDPLYNRTIQFNLHHHHLFNHPHGLEHLYCMVRLRPRHILLWPPHQLLMTLKPVSIGLSRGSGICMLLMEL